MKRAITLTLLAAFVFGTYAVAAERGTPEYERLKEYKKAQREKKEAIEAGTQVPEGPSKMDEFWRKEGERSGLGNPGERMRGFFGSLNPMPFLKQQEEKYNARKTAAQGVK